MPARSADENAKAMAAQSPRLRPSRTSDGELPREVVVDRFRLELPVTGDVPRGAVHRPRRCNDLDVSRA
jgi:hypothetical protein